MKKLVIEIELENADFREDYVLKEINRLVQDALSRLEEGYTLSSLHAIAGNRVGYFEVKEK